MSKYQTVAEKTSEFLASTGYTREEFDALLPHFAIQYRGWMSTHCLNGQPRKKRKHSDYQNSPLPTIEDKLFFILTYLKTNNLQSVQGVLFGMSQPKANLWIHCLHPILNRTLAALGELPARQMKHVVFDEEEIVLYYHDGTERPIQRPIDQELQRQYYSGKKTAHGQEQHPDQQGLQDSVSN
ncbi:MAG TPA: DDE transposase family protein [Armatimonadetes bacterium]|nr:DDE transposase family protein [Armatimonadota bacterium]